METVRIMPDGRQDLCGRIAIIPHSAADAGELAVVTPEPSLIPRQADNDAQLIELWLHGRSRHTQRAYRADALRLLNFVGKRLGQITLGDLQRFADALDAQGLLPASRNRILSAAKSLFAFAHRLGYLPFDVARPLRLTAFRDGLAERILTEAEVQRMMALEPNPRNQILLLVLYASGSRVSEIAGLRWGHLQPRDEAGQMTVFGKRGKTRTILLPPAAWSAMQSLRGSASDDAPVFLSRKQTPLCTSQITRIVKASARKARVPKAATAHFLRHSHASHALDRGAPIHLVQTTLGHASVATTGRYAHARPTDSSARYLPI